MSSINGSPPLAPPRHKPRPRSCMECYRRKLRCDRAQTCSNCIRGGATCVYTDKPIRRDRKSKARNSALVDRVAGRERQVCERRSRSSDLVFPQKRPGRLIADKCGKSRLFTDTFWAQPSTEPGPLSDSIGADWTYLALSPSDRLSYGCFPFLQPVSQTQTQIANPNLGQIRQLWDIYIHNVDPLVRILHKPTIERILDDLSLDGESFGCEVRALLLAICYAAVSSLPPSQVRVEFACDIDSYVTSFRAAVERGLMDAGLLKTHDIRVLQAFVILLTCLPRTEAYSIGLLTSLAVRIARSMGLHRDGSLFNLPPFEIEMRRRLWWHLCLLDWRTAEDVGLEATTLPSTFDTMMPLNINDTDMNVMSTNIQGLHGYTEMVFRLATYESWSVAASWNSRCTFCPCQRPMGIKEKEAELDQLLIRLEHKYLRFCRPIHTSMSRVILLVIPLLVSKLRLVASYPIYRDTAPENTPLAPENKDKLFMSAVNLLEFEQLLADDYELRGLRWFFANAHVQWHAMSYALSELCIRIEGETEAAAWDVIERVFPSSPPGRSTTGDNVWQPLEGLKQKALNARYSFMFQIPEFFTTKSNDTLFDRHFMN
ncbi:hypothetical protein M426DRAFT_22994 [Hypoxylon sp. CI-4A]|nr:hypothetical protein M426DRAFT_22994 [Hypoxylon sp. CI-4A]